MRARAHAAFAKLAKQHTSTPRLSVAAGVGVMVGSSPFFGLHVWIGAALGKILRLNQIALLLGEQISMPFLAPFVVYASVQTGHRVLEGTWLNLAGKTMSPGVAAGYVLDWCVGSLLVGASLGIVLGGAIYLVLTALRTTPPEADPKRPLWSGQSRGTGLGHAIFATTLKLLGRRGGFALLYLVVPWYFVFARAAGRHSRAYLNRVLGPRSLIRVQTDAWRHLHRFARCLVTNMLAVMGRHEEIGLVSIDRRYLLDILATGRGVVLLSAHVGPRLSGERRLPVPLNVVMLQNEAESIQRVWDRVDASDRPTIIPVNDGLAAAASIVKALNRGEAVAMLGDRHLGGPTLEVELLGDPVSLPRGPFMAAVVAGAPIVITFGYESRPDEQTFYCLPPLNTLPVARADRAAAMQTLAETFARHLESFLRAHPYEWFNFYDFWNDSANR